MSDLQQKLRSVIAGDYDTHGTLSMGGRTICDVPLIRDASDMAEMCHDAAAEIERLRLIIDSVWPQMQAERDALRAEAARLRQRAEFLRGAALYALDNRQPPAGRAEGSNSR